MATIEEILQQEDQLANAKRTLDLDAIDRIYADDLLLTGVLGEPTCSKTAVMDEIRRGIAERDPYLDELAHMTLEADTLEEKVFQMQVFYERLIISRFRLIARASRGTVLEDLCNRLATDDGIHQAREWRTSASCSRAPARR